MTTKPNLAPEHCQRIGAEGSAGDASLTLPNATQGKAFDMSLHRLEQSQSLAAAQGEAGEEVGAVVNGTFRIDAAGETYVLSTGEGIIIPPREPRVWTCTSPQGTLYRVINRTSLDASAGDGA